MKPQDGGAQSNDNVVIVKGLSLKAEENDIRHHFEEKCGEVASVELLKGLLGSKGIAFV
jgi:hypothetical protein